MNTEIVKLQIENIIQETSQAVTLVFKHPSGSRIVWKAGQFMTLIFNIGGQEYRRAYSLSSSPHTDELPSVSIKKLSNGLISTHIFDNLKIGDLVDTLLPMGNFVIEPGLQTRHVVLLGAGSGITPLFAMLKTILLTEPKSHVSLIYGNRSMESIIFYDQIQQWLDRFPLNLRVVHVLSNPTQDWQGAIGRIGEDKLEEMLYHLTPASAMQATQYYMCGPASMMETIEQVLVKIQVSKNQIFRESFFSSVDQAALTQMIEDEGIKDREVKVINGKKEHVFLVKADQSILEAAQDLGIDLPYSCQSGLCTACRGKCLSGQVMMSETEGLSQKEIEQGFVLTCVGHPKTSDVVIKIG